MITDITGKTLKLGDIIDCLNDREGDPYKYGKVTKIDYNSSLIWGHWSDSIATVNTGKHLNTHMDTKFTIINILTKKEQVMKLLEADK